MIARHLVIAVAGMLLGTAAGVAQTHTELFERAVFAEETAGNLDEAIVLYERLLQSPGVPRELAARAQQRLADGRRRQTQAVRPTSGSAEPSTGPARPNAELQERHLVWGLFPDNYNPAAGVAVLGVISAIELLHPQSVLYVKTPEGATWGFTTASVGIMIRLGWTRVTPKLGEQVLVHGLAARGTGDCPAPLPNACATLANGALHANASVIVRDNTTIFDRAVVEEFARMPREEALRLMEERRRLLETQGFPPASR